MLEIAIQNTNANDQIEIKKLCLYEGFKSLCKKLNNDGSDQSSDEDFVDLGMKSSSTNDNESIQQQTSIIKKSTNNDEIFERKIHFCKDYNSIGDFGDLYEQDESKILDNMITFIEKIKSKLEIEELANIVQSKSSFIERLKSLIDLWSYNIVISSSPSTEKKLKQFLSENFSIGNYEKSIVEYNYGWILGYFYLVYVNTYPNFRELRTKCRKLKNYKIQKIYVLFDNMSWYII